MLSKKRKTAKKKKNLQCQAEKYLPEYWSLFAGTSFLQIKKTMKSADMEKYFELFSVLMEEEKVYMDPMLTFGEICRWIGVESHDLDRWLMSELGFSGPDILKAYRGAASSHFWKKYGILL